MSSPTTERRPHRVHRVTKILLCLVLLITGLRTWAILAAQPDSLRIPARPKDSEQPLPEADR